jgi:hypothetical protein
VTAARSLLFLIGTLAVVGALWFSLMAGGHSTSVRTSGGTTAPSGSVRDYTDSIDAAKSAVQQANQDGQRGASTSVP